MNNCETTYTVTAGTTFGLLARVRFLDGTYPLIADVASFIVTLEDVTDDDAVTISTTTVTPSAAWFNALQAPTYWTATKDSTGFNLKHKLAVPTDDRLYAATINITFTNGDAARLKWPLRSE